nr:hypothetical protein [Tanacetum cinerariifolium]
MANISEDIQCAGFDTRPLMLDRTDFPSWQQRIRLYCRGKNRVNNLKSIDEGPFQMGTFQETLAEGNESALHLGLSKDIYTLINHYTDANDIWDNVKMLLEGSELIKEDRESQLYDDFEHFRQHKGETIHDYYVRFAKLINDMRNIIITMYRMQLNSKFINNMLPEWGLLFRMFRVDRIEVRGTMHEVQVHLVMGELRTELGMQIHVKQGRVSATTAMENGVALDEEQLLFIAGGQDNTVDEDVNEQPVQDLALNVDNVFQADDCDVFDSDVDEAPNAQTMFMANLSSADPVYDEAGPSYDSDFLSESMVEEVTSLKKDFKQKENKYLEEFLDMKALKEKVKDKLYKQDQSLQIVHMLCKPKPYYDEQSMVAIGYKNSQCLTCAKQVQPALYNGHKIIKTNHVPAIVHNSEDTLEIAKITRKKMKEKMKDPIKMFGIVPNRLKWFVIVLSHFLLLMNRGFR